MINCQYIFTGLTGFTGDSGQAEYETPLAAGTAGAVFVLKAAFPFYLAVSARLSSAAAGILSGSSGYAVAVQCRQRAGL